MQAETALEHRLTTARELVPRAVAETVLRVLPQPVRKKLRRHLQRSGWLTDHDPPAFDLLDSAACPSNLCPGERELARLAIFGLPGQGLSYRDKHRDFVYQQLCAEIMRFAVDEASLQSVAARAMNHPDVAADPLLAGMLRGFIAQRQAVLRTSLTPAEQQRQVDESSKLRRAFEAGPAKDFPSREELLLTFARLQRDFDGYLAQFEELRARESLERMRALRRRFPVHIPVDDLQRCEEQYDRLLKRAGQYRRQIQELACQAMAAARAGDEKTALWIRRRLQAIHTLLPNLLPADQLEQLQAQIARGAQDREAQETRRELLQRQKEVAARIKNLAGIIDRFHQLAARLPPEDEAYRRAELNYRQAVEEIRTLDTEWLSGLVLQLETLLDDLGEPDNALQSQLDRFIASVRGALNRLRLEIRVHCRKGTFQSPPAPRQPPSEPGQA